MRVPVWEIEAKEERQAQILVAVLGCSNYIFAEATWTQQLRDWIASYRRAFEFFGAVVPAMVVSDDLMSAVKKAHRYDPELNPTYRNVAVHYDIVVMPARVRTPRDMAFGCIDSSKESYFRVGIRQRMIDIRPGSVSWLRAYVELRLQSRGDAQPIF